MMVDMSRQVRVSDETHERLVKLADGRPLGQAIDRLLDKADDPDGSMSRLYLAAREVAGRTYAPGGPPEVNEDPARQVKPKQGGHTFTPQPANALRCQECGQAKHKHR
jgi:hypothetical protein